MKSQLLPEIDRALAVEIFYIAISEKAPYFIHAAGIQPPGLTASLAIGEYIRTCLGYNVEGYIPGTVVLIVGSGDSSLVMARRMV